MFKKINIPVIIFWTIFFGCLVSMLLPKYQYIKHGIPDYLCRPMLLDQIWFAIHIATGTLILTLGFFQFNAPLRNRHLYLHRILGKIYVLLSLVCIATLYLNILPKGLCTSCMPSQYLATTLWLGFVLLAIYFVRQKKIVWHQKFMISGFICASYFISIRIINNTSMGFFRAITNSEKSAYFVSDVAAWLLPLSIFWIYWYWTANRKIILP